MCRSTFVSLFIVALSVCLSISLSFSFLLPPSLSLSFPLPHSLFPHYWVLITAVIGNSLLCLCAHIHTHTLCLAAANPSGNVYVCVLWGQEREIWRDKDNERRRVSELQANSPTQQSVCCEALWGSGAVQPNCNYLREKRHGSRFITEHNIVLELLENLMLPQLSQINN